MGCGEHHGMVAGLSGRERRCESMIGARETGLHNSLRSCVVMVGDGW
jgi:hypothetical protein